MSTRFLSLRPALKAATISLAVLSAPAASAADIDTSLPPPRTAGVSVPDGQIDHAIGRLDELAAAVLEKSGIPGLAVAVIRDGKTVYARGFGVRKTGTDEPVDADTVFQLASLSKSISATVVAHQIGVGALSWDSPVAEYLPSFALKDPWVTKHVTIGDLFAHHSGLPEHAGDDLEDIGYDRAEILHRLRYLDLNSFRDDYAYTNFGLTAAAEAVAEQAGEGWATLAENAIFRPLGMNTTSARFSDFMKRNNRAVGHARIDGRFEAKFQREPDAQAPAGGVSSSVNDMAKWVAMVLQDGTYDGRRIVNSDALLPALSPQSISMRSDAVDGRASFYGYGFGVGTAPSGRVVISHSGAFALGAATNYLLIPSLDIGIVALSNAAPIGAVEALTQEFADLVQFGEITRDWYTAYAQLFAPLLDPAGSLVGKAPPSDPSPARTLSFYEGTYGNAYFGDIMLDKDGDGLVLHVGPKDMRFPLTHRDGDTFTFVPTGENAPTGSISAVSFASGNENQADSVKIEFFDEHGWGTFTREHG